MMTRSLFAGAAAALLAVPAFAAPVAYDIDPTHSNAIFAVKHMMVSTVRGEFGKVEGKVVWDAANPANSTVDATIDANTLSTREEKRDQHLKSPDFFDVANHPKITFKSTKVEAAGKGLYKVTGDLTIRGNTKPVVLDVEGPTAEVKDPAGNTKVGASATTKLNRKDFGVSWNKNLDSGGVVVSDDVTIQIDLELKKAAAAGEAPKKKS
ncbi:MAG TPA: YceI family protein [Myxococcales bacterium]|jgi:polyisoprenoid-binding protein YceI|nr:YceI family protein [Myxococcales bacterium]